MSIHPKAEQIAPHVGYEFKRLLQDARELQTQVGAVASSGPALPGTGGDHERIDRALESFLLHARNVYDFFFVAARPNCPDVSIQQFFEDDQIWRPEPDRLCPYLRTQRVRLHRSIQHLSYDRLDYEPIKEWDIRTIVTELTAVWNEFLRRLSPKCRRWFPGLGPTAQQHYSPQANLCAKTQPSVTHDTP